MSSRSPRPARADRWKRREFAGRTSLTAQLRSHLLDDLPRRRHHPQDHQRAAVDHDLAVHQNLVLAVATMDRIHVRREFPPEPRRHPDGVQSRDSECAVSNDDPGHVSLPENLGCGDDRNGQPVEVAGSPPGNRQPMACDAQLRVLPEHPLRIEAGAMRIETASPHDGMTGQAVPLHVA